MVKAAKKVVKKATKAVKKVMPKKKKKSLSADDRDHRHLLEKLARIAPSLIISYGARCTSGRAAIMVSYSHGRCRFKFPITPIGAAALHDLASYFMKCPWIGTPFTLALLSLHAGASTVSLKVDFQSPVLA